MHRPTHVTIVLGSCKYIIAVFWGCIAFWGLVYPTNIASFDTFLQNLYTNAKQGGGVQGLPQSVEKGNLYEQAYAIAQEVETTSFVEAVSYTTYTLNNLSFDAGGTSVGSCDLQTTDTLSLLYTIPSIKAELQQQVGESSQLGDASNFQNFWTSCNKLYACYKNDDITDRRQLQYCKNVASEAFYMGKIHTRAQNSLNTINVGDNIFADNNKNNSSFDLLVDIAKIGDVLFESNREPAEILFFKFPTVDVPSGDGVGPIVANNNAPAFGDAAVLGNGTQSGNSTNNSNPNDQSNSPGTNQPNTDTAAINSFIANTNDNTIANAQNPGGLISNHVCILPQAQDDTDITGGPTIDQLDTYLNDVFAQQASLFNDPVNTPPINASFGDGNGGNIANDLDTARAIEDAQRKRACAQSCEEQIDPDASQFVQEWEKSVCEANCCIQACEPLQGADKIVCTTDCLCGEIASENNIYRIKFCKIPVKAESAIPKHVMSIEEVITELGNVIKVLQQNGEPMKRTKTKEFMDSSMKDVKFASLFTFDIFIKFKPVFDTIPEHVTEQKMANQLKKNQRDILNFGTLDNSYERNKYVMIDDTAIQEGIGNIRGDLRALDSNIEKATQAKLEQLDKQAEVLLQRQAFLRQQALLESSSRVGDEVDGFLRNNLKFWKEINSTLSTMNLSAKRLKERIETEQ